MSSENAGIQLFLCLLSIILEAVVRIYPGTIVEKDFTSNLVSISRLNPKTKSSPTPRETNFAVFTFDIFFDIQGFSKQDNISFTWYYYDNVEKNNWVQMVNTINAAVYFIPHKPNLPWMVSGNEPNYDKTQNPWTDALDMLLGLKGNEAWGVEGKSDVNDIATQITKHVNSKELKLSYDTTVGATYLTSGKQHEFFHCGDFIVKAGKEAQIVNCMDCATIVSTFSNLLGSDLYQIRFGSASKYTDKYNGISYYTFNFNFQCNKIIGIGSDDWRYPLGRDPNATSGSFSYHEVAFLSGQLYTNKIYDACLKVNSNAIKENKYPQTAKTELLKCPLCQDKFFKNKV